MKVSDFVDATRELVAEFEKILWQRLEDYAEESGIPLPELTKAVLDDPQHPGQENTETEAQQ